MIKNLILPFLAVLLSIYYGIVPSDAGMLPSLQNTTNEIYVDDTFKEHGYLDLSHGNTHYYMIGKKTGRKLVFVHGMGSPGPLLKKFLEELGRKGYRVLGFDLYGRGYSDSPGVRY